MAPLPDLLTDPVTLAVVTLVIAAVVWHQRTLTWTEYRQIHRLKMRVFPLLDGLDALPSLVNPKGYHDDPEYLTTTSRPVSGVWKRLVREGGSPHLVNAIKRRRVPTGGAQLSTAHVVWTHDDGTQTEAYLFPARGEPGTDIYCHHETSVRDPDGHLTDAQTDGDPRGVVRAALGMDVERDASARFGKDYTRPHTGQHF